VTDAAADITPDDQQAAVSDAAADDQQDAALPVIPVDQHATASLNDIQKYGNMGLSITCQDFLDAGYKFGDVVTVSFKDQTVDMPFCSNYSGVNADEPVLVARSEDIYIKLVINLGDFASYYGLAEKHVEDDETITWTWADGSEDDLEITISMKEPGGYYGMYLAHLLEYTNERSDYPDLTDEQFANFRIITTTGMGENILYRTSSPVNPEINRNTYADKALKDAGVTVIMDLTDDEETLQAFEGFADTYYATAAHIALNMSVNFTDPDTHEKLARGLRFFAENPGIYAIHCSDGNARTGMVSALLECFTGASYEEVVSDYMETYYNYYGITRDDDRYNSISQDTIIKELETLFRVEDLKTADLAQCAEAFFLEIGLTEEEVAALRNNLAGN